MTDVLEARPHGRLLTPPPPPPPPPPTVLARDLYFANGVAVSPDQGSLIFCETVMMRCSRYHINGDKAGTVDKFIDNLPGFPDNIRYDGDGRYWIAISAERTLQWDVLSWSPFVRKLVHMVDKYVVAVPHSLKNAGAMSVTLAGEPVSMYSDPGLAVTTGWLKVGDCLYYGSLTNPYLSKINIAESPAEKAEE
uniref:Strictosidine synthase conserved region domain-containing protein n=1 Tax=Oryza brachyantha TaxID=4533 RepID=J3N4J9_ORYBR